MIPAHELITVKNFDIRRSDLLLGFVAVVLLRWESLGCVLGFEVSVWLDGMKGLVMEFMEAPMAMVSCDQC